MCSTTSATTVALATVGEPTASLPSLLTKRTRSKVTGCPASTARRSISSVSLAVTRYCLLPVSNTAYINHSDQRDADETRMPRWCQHVRLSRETRPCRQEMQALRRHFGLPCRGQPTLFQQ